MSSDNGSFSPFTPQGNNGERATHKRMIDLRREMESYSGLVDVCKLSNDNQDKEYANLSRDLIINIIKTLRSDETIPPGQKIHVKEIVRKAIDLLKCTARYVIDPVIDKLPCSAGPGGAVVSGRSALVQSVHEAKPSRDPVYHLPVDGIP